MAQRISQMPAEAIPAAQASLPYSSVERGIGAMTQPNMGMKNMNDGSTYPKFGNPQPERNIAGQLQNVQQNAVALAPQKAAEAQGMVVKKLNEDSTAAYQAQNDMQTTLANIMEATGNNEATIEMGNAQLFPKRMQEVAFSRKMGRMMG